MKYLNYDVKRGRKNQEDSELLSDLKIRALSDYQIFEYMVNMIKENPGITENDLSLLNSSHILMPFAVFLADTRMVIGITPPINSMKDSVKSLSKNRISI